MEFEQSIYSVYAKVDKNNKITKVFSTCFEQPQETDILIKSGHGDEYVHVQGQYQIYNEDGTHKYCMDNGIMRECTLEELEAERATFPVPEPSETDQLRADVDYIAVMTGIEL